MPDNPGAAVAHNLNWQRLAFVDERIVRYSRENGIEPVHYDEVATVN